jgi:hypothetical protein
VTKEGSTESFIEKILDKRKKGQGKQYLVRWLGYGEESDLWVPSCKLVNCEALEVWEKENGE